MRSITVTASHVSFPKSSSAGMLTLTVVNDTRGSFAAANLVPGLHELWAQVHADQEAADGDATAFWGDKVSVWVRTLSTAQYRAR